MTLQKTAIVVLVLLGLVQACTSRRGTDPKPVSGSRVYVEIMEEPLKLLMIDGDADTIVDSIALPGDWDLVPVTADPLTPRVAVIWVGSLHIYRAGQTEPEGVFNIPSTEVAFTDEQDLMVGSWGGIGCMRLIFPRKSGRVKKRGLPFSRSPGGFGPPNSSDGVDGCRRPR